MTAIQLSEEQKSRILEMAKALFPEYKFWRLHDGSCDLCTENTLDFHEDENPRWNSWHRMHWFEFCYLHLTTKIGNSPRTNHSEFYDETNLRGEICFRQEWFNDFHMVDFLYENFQKIITS